MHDLDHGVAGLVVELGVPEFFKPAVRGRVGDALVVGEHHRDQAGIAGALHVVLATQRVQARAGLANLTGDADQRDQATRVVGAVHMLADAHAPQDHGALGLGKGTRHLAQGLRRDAANRRHRLRAVAFHVLAQRLEVVGAPGNEVLVRQAFIDHGVDQRIEHGHVGVGLELQRAPGVFADVGHARVGQYDFGAGLGGVLHPGGSHRVVGGGVGADHQNQLGVGHVIHLVADRARTDALQQGRHAGGVAQPGAMVDVVGAKAGAHQLLEQVGFLVTALGRAKTSQGLGAVIVTQAFEPTRGQRQRLVPAGFTEHRRPVGAVAVQRLQGLGVFGHAGTPDQRHRQALGAVGVIKTETSFDAQAAVVGRAITPVHTDNFVVFHVVGQQAAYAAKRADRVHLFVHHLRAHLRLGH